MSAKDKYHESVVEALIKEGWTITHDPLYLKVGSVEFFIDIGAERLIAAEKGNEQIAVEIKSFLGPSFITAFYGAIGQFISYQEALLTSASTRTLFLAVPVDAYESDIKDEPIIRSILEKQRIKLIVYNAKLNTIEQWIP